LKTTFFLFLLVRSTHRVAFFFFPLWLISNNSTPFLTCAAFDPLQPVSLSEDESGPQQNRLFRQASAATGPPYVPPSYPAGHYDHHEHGYSYQSINGQYVNTG
jgi:hypothetical protein